MLRSPLLCSAQTETKNCTVKYFLDYAPQLPADTNPTLSRCSRVLASAYLGLHSPAPAMPLLSQAALQPHPRLFMGHQSHLSPTNLALAGSASSIYLDSQGLEQYLAFSRHS